MWHRVLACSLILTLCLLQACATAVMSGAAQPGGDPAAGDGRTREQLSQDAAITSAINTRYVQDALVNALDVKVHTRGGVVTLYGTVPSAAAADRAGALARGVKGVRKVVSRLRVMN